jgi:hypothetical protein
MQTDRPRFVIGDRELAEISAYCEIALANKSLLTLSELAQLTSIDATEEEFEIAWHVNKPLRSRFRLESGYVMDGQEAADSRVRVDAEYENRATAKRNVAIASEFADLCKGRRVKLLAVAGGNSYNSARRGDDIDLFCVTTKNSLWVFMLKALLLARVYGSTRKSPPFCFSYVVDEEKARSEFSEAKDGLFARDALAAHILAGQSFYRSLLLEGSWMERYFPRMYTRRIARQDADERPQRHRTGSALLNSFLFYSVGSYVRMKAALLNRKYKSRGDSSAVFHSRIGKDHCVYESNRYRRLRRIYAKSGGRVDP